MNNNNSNNLQTQVNTMQNLNTEVNNNQEVIQPENINVQPNVPVQNVQEQILQNNNELNQPIQNIATIEQNKEDFINKVQSEETNKTQENKSSLNITFIVILFVIIFLAILFLFPYLAKTL